METLFAAIAWKDAISRVGHEKSQYQDNMACVQPWREMTLFDRQGSTVINECMGKSALFVTIDGSPLYIKQVKEKLCVK